MQQRVQVARAQIPIYADGTIDTRCMETPVAAGLLTKLLIISDHTLSAAMRAPVE